MAVLCVPLYWILLVANVFVSIRFPCAFRLSDARVKFATKTHARTQLDVRDVVTNEQAQRVHQEAGRRLLENSKSVFECAPAHKLVGANIRRIKVEIFR